MIRSAFALVVLACLLGASTASALKTTRGPPLRRLAELSDLVIVGRLVAIEDSGEYPELGTATLAVERVLFGEPGGDEVRVSRVCDGVEVLCMHGTTYPPGEPVLTFLRRATEQDGEGAVGTYRPIHPYGTWRVEEREPEDPESRLRAGRSLSEADVARIAQFVTAFAEARAEASLELRSALTRELIVQLVEDPLLRWHGLADLRIHSHADGRDSQWVEGEDHLALLSTEQWDRVVALVPQVSLVELDGALLSVVSSREHEGLTEMLVARILGVSADERLSSYWRLLGVVAGRVGDEALVDLAESYQSQFNLRSDDAPLRRRELFEAYRARLDAVWPTAAGDDG